jgi:hypothetical protein
MQGAEALDLSFRITDWLSLFGSAGGFAAAGNDRRSFLVRGANYLYGAGGGALLRLYRNEGTQLAISASGRYSSGKLFPLGTFAVNLSSAPLATLADVASGDLSELLITPSSEVKAGGGLAVAQRLSSLLSLQGDLRADWARRRFEPFIAAEGARRTFYSYVTAPSLGVALGADFAGRGAPLAALLEYRSSLAISDNDFLGSKGTIDEQTVALGLYYSGRTYLQLGVTGYWRFNLLPIEIVDDNGQTRASSKPRQGGGTLILRNFW